ncbi:hypothetical protein EVAR_86250_1 [Eumeta japonica]|uniref:Uncharacterized protein n=1 Tax=Eumeta variegata TaxID=151549 RepID=A0A4C1UBM1_EUMVA|nr:hypothetical protein EVAR_86250_1 [Eumeta japonica]
MIKVITPLTSGCQPYINHMIRTRYETNHSSNKENGTLKTIFRFSYCKSTHSKEAYSDYQKDHSSTNRLPVFSDLRMIPAIIRLSFFNIFMN